MNLPDTIIGSAHNAHFPYYLGAIVGFVRRDKHRPAAAHGVSCRAHETLYRIGFPTSSRFDGGQRTPLVDGPPKAVRCLFTQTSVSSLPIPPGPSENVRLKTMSGVLPVTGALSDVTSAF
ncbi:hypothetical protein [uncultured Roseobacter sp.]|uniref:hypothetical protein n=1 Tax=uncultured Roseobacter sp. TaxID=114847 RepID=UPI002638306E|nr:hypothetical protein [uncultured Roseobacter sp.]